MGYLFLILALFMGITKGYCGKRISGKIKNYSEALAANILRMFLCIIIGFFISSGKVLVNDKAFWLSSALSGISTAVFVVTWLFSVRCSAYMFVEVACVVGVLVPVISGMFLFDAPVLAKQWAGIAILVVAVYIMTGYNKSITNKMRVKDVIVLAVCGLSNGLTSLAQKMFVEYTKGASTATFNFYTYLIAFVVLFMWYKVNKFRLKKAGNKNDIQKAEPIKWIKSYGIYICIMSVCLFLNSFFNTVAAGYLEPITMYPLSQGMALIASTLMATLVYKEKMSFKGIVGIILSFTGILFINVL